MTQQVGISWVRCHLGGARFFAHCPRCSRRSLVLYLYGKRFVCRHCTRLRYRSQTVDLETRVTFAIRRLQSRLAPDFDPDDLDIEMVPYRPRGMRGRTYRRLAERTERLIEAREDIWNERIFGLMRRIGAVPDDLLKRYPPT